SRTFHAVCPYWLMSSAGSNAHAGAAHNASIPVSMKRNTICFELTSPWKGEDEPRKRLGWGSLLCVSEHDPSPNPTSPFGLRRVRPSLFKGEKINAPHSASIPANMKRDTFHRFELTSVPALTLLGAVIPGEHRGTRCSGRGSIW